MLLRHTAIGVISGWRGRSFQVAGMLALFMLVAALLAAAFSARQPQTVAMDVGLSGIRLGLTFLVLAWTLELIAKEIDRRTVFFVLAYPVPRWSYLLGRIFAIWLLALLAGIFLALLLYIIVQYASWGYQYPHSMNIGWSYIVTIALYWIDVVLISCFAVAVATIATSTLMPMLMGIMFAAASRMIGPVLDYLRSGAGGDDQLVRGFSPVLSKLYYFVPDLDRLDVRYWVLYGNLPDVTATLLSLGVVAIYSMLLLLCAIYAFNRRQFV